MEKEAITENIHQDMFTKKLEGVGGAPICKTCKYRTYSNHCKKHLDIITGKPYACDACRELKHDFICGIEGKFYEEKPKKKRRLSNSFILTVMHGMLFGAVWCCFSFRSIFCCRLCCCPVVGVVKLVYSCRSHIERERLS